MRFKTWVSILSIGFVIFGCSTTPSYEKPTWGDAQLFKEEVAANGSQAQLNPLLTPEQVEKINANVQHEQHVIDKFAIAAIGTQ